MYKKIFFYSVLLIGVIFLISTSDDYNSNGINFSNSELLLNPCSNGPDTLFVTISQPDSVKILWAKLFWAKGFNPWDSVFMTNIGGNNWKGIIYLTGPATYRYYIKIMDSLNRTATRPAGAPGNFYSFITFPDTTKPTISHTPIGNTPKQNWPVTVVASVTDNCGLDSAWVRWKINQGSFKQFKLIHTTGNIFTSSFNSTQSEVNIGDTIRYRIIALDISTFQNKDSTGLYSFLITQTVGIEPVSKIIPERYNLYQNYPNPFNPVTRINFDISKQGFVILKIFDVVGSELYILVNEIKSAGQYSIGYDASSLPSGLYFYKLDCNGYSETKKMVLLK